jgi:hypothetical protein
VHSAVETGGGGSGSEGSGKIVSGGGPERFYPRIRSDPRGQQIWFTNQPLLRWTMLRYGVATGPRRMDFVRIRDWLRPYLNDAEIF